MIRIGVTGTDTGVGKTVVSCAIIAALRDAKMRVAAMKPIESGGTLDAEQLWRATGMVFPMDLVCPVSLAEPLAPLLASRRGNAEIDLAVLDAAFAQLSCDADAIVVEGAGGLLVPITREESYATLFGRWNLDLVIVAANRLGVLNHTLLTVHAAREYGLRVRVVVLNTISDRPDGLAESTNLAMLRELLPDVSVLPFPYAGNNDALPKISLNCPGFDNVA
jgi:dethiobiotin synthetase